MINIDFSFIIFPLNFGFLKTNQYEYFVHTYFITLQLFYKSFYLYCTTYVYSYKFQIAKADK